MAQFMLDEVPYEMVMLDDLDLDEMIEFRRMSGMAIDEVLNRIEDEHYEPGIVKALMVIGIKRAKPETSLREIEQRVGKLKFAELADVFTGTDARPPAREPSEPSESSTAASEPSSEPIPESEILESSGSPISDGFTSFHSRSAV